jgi:hypothetical protein
MSKLEEIKLQLELWDNQYPLDPPSDKRAEILYETVKLRANIFKDNAVEHVRTLLSRLEIAEKALEETHKHGGSQIMKISSEALQQIRGG